MKNSTTDLSDLSYKLLLSRPAEDTLLLELAGNWQIHGGLPSSDEVQQEMETLPRLRRLAFDTRQMTDWDSGLLTFLMKIHELCAIFLLHRQS